METFDNCLQIHNFVILLTCSYNIEVAFKILQPSANNQTESVLYHFDFSFVAMSCSKWTEFGYKITYLLVEIFYQNAITNLFSYFNSSKGLEFSSPQCCNSNIFIGSSVQNHMLHKKKSIHVETFYKNPTIIFIFTF